MSLNRNTGGEGMGTGLRRTFHSQIPVNGRQHCLVVSSITIEEIKDTQSKDIACQQFRTELTAGERTPYAEEKSCIIIRIAEIDGTVQILCPFSLQKITIWVTMHQFTVTLVYMSSTISIEGLSFGALWWRTSDDVICSVTLARKRAREFDPMQLKWSFSPLPRLSKAW